VHPGGPLERRPGGQLETRTAGAESVFAMLPAEPHPLAHLNSIPIDVILLSRVMRLNWKERPSSKTPWATVTV
jgi:hypothetical protein